MFWGGPSLAVKTVKEYLGIPINHVMVVDFQGFPRLVNAVGGIDMYVPQDDHHRGGLGSGHARVVTFKKGMHHFDGKDAMLYVRIRKRPTTTSPRRAPAGVRPGAAEEARTAVQHHQAARDRQALHERRRHRPHHQPDPRARLPQVARQGRQEAGAWRATPGWSGGGQPTCSRPTTPQAEADQQVPRGVRPGGRPAARRRVRRRVSPVSTRTATSASPRAGAVWPMRRRSPEASPAANSSERHAPLRDVDHRAHGRRAPCCAGSCRRGSRSPSAGPSPSGAGPSRSSRGVTSRTHVWYRCAEGVSAAKSRRPGSSAAAARSSRRVHRPAHLPHVSPLAHGLDRASTTGRSGSCGRAASRATKPGGAGAACSTAMSGGSSALSERRRRSGASVVAGAGERRHLRPGVHAGVRAPRDAEAHRLAQHGRQRLLEHPLHRRQPGLPGPAAKRRALVGEVETPGRACRPQPPRVAGPVRASSPRSCSPRSRRHPTRAARRR